MTPKNNPDQGGDDTLGVLDDAASLDDAIGLVGATAQVTVALPAADEDDLGDDEVVGDEIAPELLLDTSGLADHETVQRLNHDSIVIELPADLAAPIAQTPESEPETESEPEPETIVAEVVEEEAEAASAEPSDVEDIVTVEELPAATAAETRPSKTEPSASAAGEPVPKPAGAKKKPRKPAGKKIAPERAAAPAPVSAAEPIAETSPQVKRPVEEPAAVEETTAPQAAAPAEVPVAGAARPASPERVERVRLAPSRPSQGEAVGREERSSRLEPTVQKHDPPREESPARTDRAARTTSVPQKDDTTNPTPAPQEDRSARPESAGTPEPRKAASASQAEKETDVMNEETAVAPREPIRPQPAAEVTLTSKRLGETSREASRESADLLTADRLLDPSRIAKPEPEGAWSHFLYTISGRRINIGDGKQAKARKELTGRISAPLAGTARFVPVLSRKGGVGKTAVTALLGMALADARDDRVIAVDANPDRGTLADRIVGAHGKSVRDLAKAKDDIRGYHDISALVARDHTRLDVLASDSDPRVADAFGEEGYRDVAAVAAHYYSLVLTDTGTGIVHEVMGATLDLADQLVIVSGLSVDEARLASETITWLETNGFAEKARDAIVVLNQSTPGTPLVRLNELEAHFTTRVRHVVRVPYDAQIAGGGAIDFASLAPETRRAARELAAHLVEGLRTKAVR
ncbi:MinD/ParA family protein [Microbacterium sp.]|uniref:MinD/ParA family ATP-binding protein n=1 Tax=Microbacterium sp. TaxID=51671 RepID=UPI00334241AB